MISYNLFNVYSRILIKKGHQHLTTEKNSHHLFDIPHASSLRSLRRMSHCSAASQCSFSTSPLLLLPWTPAFSPCCGSYRPSLLLHYLLDGVWPPLSIRSADYWLPLFSPYSRTEMSRLGPALFQGRTNCNRRDHIFSKL